MKKISKVIGLMMMLGVVLISCTTDVDENGYVPPAPMVDPTDDPTTVYHTVNFYDGDILVETKSVEDGTCVESVSMDSTSKHKFLGWTKNPNTKYVSYYGFSTKVTSDINLYAKWENHYSVTFYDDEDNVVATIGDVIEGNKIKTSEIPTNPTDKYNKSVKQFYYWKVEDEKFDPAVDVVTKDLKVVAKYRDVYYIRFNKFGDRIDILFNTYNPNWKSTSEMYNDATAPTNENIRDYFEGTINGEKLEWSEEKYNSFYAPNIQNGDVFKANIRYGEENIYIFLNDGKGRIATNPYTF